MISKQIEISGQIYTVSAPTLREVLQLEEYIKSSLESQPGVHNLAIKPKTEETPKPRKPRNKKSE